jgi:hypothetical protein
MDILKKILMYLGPLDAIHMRRVSCGRMMSSRRDREPIPFGNKKAAGKKKSLPAACRITC